MTLFVLIQVIFAAALAWSCFCRLVRTDERTHREIRLSIWFEGVVAGLVMGAPVLPFLMPELCKWPLWSTPSEFWLLLLAAAAVIQMTTGRYWRNGVPDDFTQRWS